MHVTLRNPPPPQRNRGGVLERTASQETLKTTEKPWTKRVGMHFRKFLKIALTVLITVLVLAAVLFGLVYTDTFKIKHFLSIRDSLGLPGNPK